MRLLGASEETGVHLDPTQARLDELLEELGKSGIPDQDSSSNTSSSQRRPTRNCLVDDGSNGTTATT